MVGFYFLPAMAGSPGGVAHLQWATPRPYPYMEKTSMPYKSKAQAAKFHEMEKEGKISPKTVKEFDKASKGKKLPETVPTKKK